jgi:hypothetical protein
MVNRMRKTGVYRDLAFVAISIILILSACDKVNQPTRSTPAPKWVTGLTELVQSDTAKTLAKNLEALNPFFTKKPNQELFFNAGTARNAGIHEEWIKYAEMISRFGNEALQGLDKPQTDAASATAAEVITALKPFFDELYAAHSTLIGQIDPPNIKKPYSPAPTYHCPTVRAGCPGWYCIPASFTESGARSWLINNGYHSSVCCPCGDWSKHLSSPYWSGVYRMQGIMDRWPESSAWRVRYSGPEPNPELCHYVWPYWWWPLYVAWFHDAC